MAGERVEKASLNLSYFPVLKNLSNMSFLLVATTNFCVREPSNIFNNREEQGESKRESHLDGNSKREGIVAGQNVPEIACRDRNLEFGVGQLGSLPGLEEGEHVVNNLRQNAGPIYRVDCRQMVLCLKVEIAEEVLHNILISFRGRRPMKHGHKRKEKEEKEERRKKKKRYLAVIEGALHRNVVHVTVENGGHLKLLNRGHLPLGVEDVDLDVFLTAETTNRGTSK